MKRIVIDAMHFSSQHDDDHILIVEHRAKFYDFIIDLDKRYEKNFLETFPEMAGFFEKCRLAKEKILSL